jgi:LysM repeat protein
MRRRLIIPVAALLGTMVAGACSGDDDGAFATLPPIRTTTTTTTTSTTISTETQYYVVQSGDFLSIIAEQFGVPMQAIMDANGITDPNAIQAGETLRIPAGVVAQSTLPGRATTVPADQPGDQPGDTTDVPTGTEGTAAPNDIDPGESE